MKCIFSVENNLLSFARYASSVCERISWSPGSVPGNLLSPFSPSSSPSSDSSVSSSPEPSSLGSSPSSN